LFRKLARVEITNRARLNFAGIELRNIDGFLPSLDDDMSNSISFILQVALKIRAPAAENVNRLTHSLA
jgi:hypothetical protein